MPTPTIVNLPVFDLLALFLRRNREKEVARGLSEAQHLVEETPITGQLPTQVFIPPTKITPEGIERPVSTAPVGQGLLDVPELEPTDVRVSNQLTELEKRMLELRPDQAPEIVKYFAGLREFTKAKGVAPDVVQTSIAQLRNMGVAEEAIQPIEKFIAETGDYIRGAAMLDEIRQPAVTGFVGAESRELGALKVRRSPEYIAEEEEARQRQLNFEIEKLKTLEKINSRTRELDKWEDIAKDSKFYTENNLEVMNKKVEEANQEFDNITFDESYAHDLFPQYSPEIPYSKHVVWGTINTGGIKALKELPGVKLTPELEKKVFEEYQTLYDSQGHILDKLGYVARKRLEAYKAYLNAQEFATDYTVAKIYRNEIKGYTIKEDVDSQGNVTNRTLINTNTGKEATKEEIKLLGMSLFGITESMINPDLFYTNFETLLKKKVEETSKEKFSTEFLDKLKSIATSTLQSVGETVGGFNLANIEQFGGQDVSPEATTTFLRETAMGINAPLVGLGALSGIAGQYITSKIQKEATTEKPQEIAQRFGFTQDELNQIQQEIINKTSVAPRETKASTAAIQFATNPTIQNKIRNNPSYINIIVKELLRRGVITPQEETEFVETVRGIVFGKQ